MTKNKGRKKCKKIQIFKTSGEAFRAAQRLPKGKLFLGTARPYWCGQHKGYHFTTH